MLVFQSRAWSVGRCMKKLKLHLYSYTMVQEFTSDGDERRSEFCEWIWLKVNFNENFYKQTAFSDEAVFHVNGTVNKYNLHFWRDYSPLVTYQVRKISESSVIDRLEHAKLYRTIYSITSTFKQWKILPKSAAQRNFLSSPKRGIHEVTVYQQLVPLLSINSLLVKTSWR